jgi:adenine-specific DNA-methyltransferase
MNESNQTNVTQSPRTEGIKYAGSKLKLIPHILNLIQPLQVSRVFDGFAGTTRVSQAFAQSGFQVCTNDISDWSKTFSDCYLRNRNTAENYNGLIEHLNGLSPSSGWFTENFGGLAQNGNAIQPDGLKRPWQIHNTQKLDAIRDEIDLMSLTETQRAVALTSLILALDKVDNTVGHYVSYLKKWSRRSFNHLQLKVPLLFANDREHQVLQGDVFDVVGKVDCELAYFDPPYGSNNEKMPPSRVRYASYYHLWTTVCRNDRPALVGKARRRADCSDRISASAFEEFRRNPDTGRFMAVESIERLIAATPAKWIVFSYNNAGRATAEELRTVLESSGEILEVREIDYRKNVMASMRWTDDWVRPSESQNRELLFLLEKSS